MAIKRTRSTFEAIFTQNELSIFSKSPFPFKYHHDIFVRVNEVLVVLAASLYTPLRKRYAYGIAVIIVSAIPAQIRRGYLALSVPFNAS